MKVVQINATCGIGSTGKICVGISCVLTAQNVENYVLYSSKSSGYELGVRCANDRYIKTQALRSRILGNYGFNSRVATRRIIAELEKLRPDIVHLHNIHGHDCHLGMLFSYFKRQKTKLIWTFHDCWGFTGYCAYFDAAGCNKWQKECSRCIKRKEHSWFFDRSSELFKKKKQLFEGVDLTIVTPSQWLAALVKQSFLREYPVKVINNGIDLSIFKPTGSDFRQRYGLENKKIILGVSFGWDKRKGLDMFVNLAGRLPDSYKIVLVGTDAATDDCLPDGVISIHRTQNQKELAEIYTAADVFLNPTREENYPTVNMEAIACGTPVLTFRTGGSPEMLDETCGAVVACDDVDALEGEIIRICTEKTYSQEMCERKSREFDQNKRFKEYFNLYEDVVTARNQTN